jgi:hypothetical protein
MATLQTTFLSFTFMLAVISSKGQVNDETIRQQVLEKGIVDSLFIFGKWTENGGTETHLKYFGQLKTKSRQTFKIINSIWLWGLSHRATSRLLVFNNKNQYVGNYYMTTTSDLPDKLQNGRLIFSNTDDQDCDKTLITIIDLTKGLPRQFFIKCKGKSGDIYNFSTE